METDLDIWQAKLAMYDRVIPCFFETSEEGCEAKAALLAFFDHITESGCDQPPLPLCDVHANLIKMSTGFWAEWFNRPRFECMNCDAPLELNRFERI